MKVYKYDIKTKEFLQELEINEAYGTNLPFTTTIKPLAKKDGFAVCFNGTKWEYIEDNRAIELYHGKEKYEIGSNVNGQSYGGIGDIPEWLSTEPEPPTTEQIASSARYERDKALKALDEVVINPLRFSELLEEQRLEAVTFRRLLLDVPQQKGFPSTYEMPEVPSWLS